MDRTATPLVFVAKARSGTTALQEVVETTGSVCNFGEVFHDSEQQRKKVTNYFYFKERNPPPFIVPTVAEVRRYFIGFINYLAAISDKPWFLMDIKYSSWHHFLPVWHENSGQPFQLRLLKELGAPIIHITRSNLFRQYLSHVYATNNDRWNYQRGEEGKVSTAGIYVDVKAAKGQMDLTSYNAKCFRGWLQGYTKAAEVEYESAFVDGAPDVSYLKSALGSLEIPTEFSNSISQAKTPIQVPQLVDNQSEVLRFFAGSPYEQQVIAAFQD
jgi:LPS sulfotransferase NodH